MNKKDIVNTAEYRLKTKAQTPFEFSVNIHKELKKENLLFEIRGNDITTGLCTTRLYRLANSEHQSYLDFFKKLADDFGLRTPQNRQKTIINTSLDIGYTELLTSNLHSSILYGYGDPAVIKIDDDNERNYYLLVTSNDAPNSFPIIRSKDLINWKLDGYVFPEGKKPEWAADGKLISDYWAPEMHLHDNEYRVYFVARDKDNHELCIGMARSTKPSGPFVTDKKPILKGNVIDPHVFAENKDTVYLYWKEDNNDIWPGLLADLLSNHPELINELFLTEEDKITASFMITIWPWAKQLEPMERFQVLQVLIESVISNFSAFRKRLLRTTVNQDPEIRMVIQNVLQYMKTPMFAQQLSADGSALIGERTLIIENDQDWEAHLVEGMWLSKHQTKYYLFYAGNDFSTDQYGIGVATSDAPLGPFTKMNEPFLKSTANWWAPGHPSVVMGEGNTAQMFLHAFYPGKAGYKQFRSLLSIQIKFEGNRVTIQ